MSLTKVTYSMINSSIFNVLDYGAVGDGVADDTAAVQAAINAAVASVSAGGATVYFPRGNYNCTNLTLANKSGLHLTGDASTVYSCIKISGKITCNNTTDFRCNNLKFVGANFNFSTRLFSASPTAGNLLFEMVDSCANWSVQDCNFAGFANVFQAKSGGATGSYVIRINNNYFEANTISLRLDLTLHWDVTGNTFAEDYQSNLYITSGSELRYSGNKHENGINAMSGNNVYIDYTNQQVSDIVITENTFHQFYGIEINDAVRVTVSNNSSRIQLSSFAVEINGASDSIIVDGNNFNGYTGSANSTYGVSISNTANNINICGNNLVNFEKCVYSAIASGVILISDNFLSANTYAVEITGNSADRRIVVQNNTANAPFKSTTNTGYWIEKLNRIINATPIVNTDGYMDQFYIEGSAAPTTGIWKVGDIVWNTAPTAGGTIGFVCTTAGTPGTWKTWGAIAA
jgi:hypothetical protein